MNKQEKVGIGEIAQTVIEPGKVKALLVLDDGREIELGDRNASQGLEASGIVVVSDSSRIKYNQEEGTEEKEVMNKIIVDRVVAHLDILGTDHIFQINCLFIVRTRIDFVFHSIFFLSFYRLVLGEIRCTLPQIAL